MSGAVTYGDISPRTAAYAAKDFLKRGMPYLCLEKFGQATTLPDHSTKTVKFRRYNALPNAPKALMEGVKPSGSKLTTTDVSITLQQYGDYVPISDVVMDTHEDPVLQQASEVLSEQAAQMIERVRHGVLRACTNAFFVGAAGAAVASKSLVAGPWHIDLQRRVTRALKRQNARTITKVVRSTPDYGTEAVAASFIALIHPDLEPTLREYAGFVPVEKYGSMTPYENELGKVEDVRYLTTTLLDPELGAGASGTSGLLTSGGNADVYPILFLAADAYGVVALKGAFAVQLMVANPKATPENPLAQYGTVGWKSMQGAVILNDAWMAVAHVGAKA